MGEIDKLEESLRACLAGLERYESRFAGLLHEAGQTPSQPTAILRRGEERAWDDTLSAATSLEGAPLEGETALRRWLTALAGWQTLVEQTASPQEVA